MGRTTFCFKKVLGALLLLLITVSCNPDIDPPTAIESRVKPATSADEGVTGGISLEPRFTIALSVKGAFKPGLPIHAVLRGQGRYATEQAEVSIRFPDIEAARLSGFNSAFRVPVKETIPAAAEQLGAVGVGQAMGLEATAFVPAPGYYRVVAGAKQTSVYPTALDGQWVSDATYKTLWVWISEDGGTVTESFDASLFPEGAIVAPGPLRYKPDSQIPFLSGRGSLSLASTVTVQLLYYNSLTSQYEPIPYAEWQTTWTDYSDPYNPKERFGGGYANANGEFDPGCPGNYDSGYDGDFFSNTRKVNASYSDGDKDIGNFVVSHGDCYETTYIQAQAVIDGLARVIVVADNTARSAELSFGRSRPHLPYHVRNAASLYDVSGDYVVMKAGDIWSTWGTWVNSHEYGHAYQNKALGGLFDNYNVNCSPHFYDRESSMGCAASEGFADFFAETIGGTNVWNDETGHGYVGSTDDGAMIEGGVAAFFHDLADAADEANDNIASYPLSYIGDIVVTCRRDGYKPSGVDHLIFCFEQDIDPVVTSSSVYFPNRSSFPSSYSESASEPNGWSKTDIRENWIWNLYNEN